ncbi:MAG: hypothetical protein EZS28_025360 [Streblomastix strix]|uniref:Uncharacterized protein n=1 Tax=Streblomastix strix TaxID=222440 RepID=A0A5J4V9D5_9EUKA|nr:MAG: hypothetical protein EZS28_025360 [Streblomastix strix]
MGQKDRTGQKNIRRLKLMDRWTDGHGTVEVFTFQDTSSQQNSKGLTVFQSSAGSESGDDTNIPSTVEKHRHFLKF